MKSRNYCPVCYTKILDDTSIFIDRVDSFYIRFFKKCSLLEAKAKELQVNRYRETLCPLCKESLVVFYYETGEDKTSPYDYIETIL